MFSVPSTWPEGEYVAYLEINTEGDYNGIFNDTRYPTPMSSDWDSWAMSYGYPYRGQPSVVYSVPFTLGAARRTYSTMMPVGFGSVDGTDADPGALHAMDGTITDDPRRAGQRRRPAAHRRARPRAWRSRFVMASAQPAARAPGRAHRRAGRRSEALARVGAPALQRAAQLGRPHRAVRSPRSARPDRPPATPTRSSRACPARRRREDGGPDGPGRRRARQPRRRRLRRADPVTHYWIGVRAVDGCNRAGPHAVAEITTTRDQLHPAVPVTHASSRRRPGDRRWSRRWRRCAAPATSCWPRSRCSRSRPTSTAARGLPRPGPAAQRYGPGARPPASGPPRPTTRPGAWSPYRSRARAATSVVDKGRSTPIIPPSCARGLPDYGRQRAKKRGFSRAMPTINQLVKFGRKAQRRKTASPALKACPQRRGVCIRVYTTTPEEAELGAPQGRARSSDERDGSDDLHPGRGTQPAGALGRPHPRRPRQGSPGRSLPHHPRHARHLGRRQPPPGPSKYGAKRPSNGAKEEPCHVKVKYPSASSCRIRSSRISRSTCAAGDEVRQHRHDARQEGDRRAHRLRRLRHRRREGEGRSDEGVGSRAQQRAAEGRGQVPPRRWRDLPGSRRRPAGPRHRARHALAHLAARDRSEDDDAGEARGRAARRSPNRGNAVKKREDTHKMADANKAFAHYRW